MMAFFWQVVNFLVLAVLVVWLVRKYDLFERVFGNYRRQIKAELEAAQRHEQEARQLKADTARALAQADARAAEVLTQAQAQAEREKAELIKNAAAEAERIREQAQLASEAEYGRQLVALQEETISQTLERAREWVTRSLTPQDHQRLLDAFLGALSEESLRV